MTTQAVSICGVTLQWPLTRGRSKKVAYNASNWKRRLEEGDGVDSPTSSPKAPRNRRGSSPWKYGNQEAEDPMFKKEKKYKRKLLPKDEPKEEPKKEIKNKEEDPMSEEADPIADLPPLDPSDDNSSGGDNDDDAADESSTPPAENPLVDINVDDEEMSEKKMADQIRQRGISGQLPSEGIDCQDVKLSVGELEKIYVNATGGRPPPGADKKWYCGHLTSTALSHSDMDTRESKPAFREGGAREKDG